MRTGLLSSPISTMAQPILLVPKSNPNMRFINHYFSKQSVKLATYFVFHKIIIIFASQIMKAIHNKDYSVVKTFKAGFAARLFT
jgi:hypothetical protein